MKVNNLFTKNIQREIEGVVKVGQETEKIINLELDEYVVTKELNKHFDKFFARYSKGINTDTGKIGVWISGFFGSGKSHFLKILSYILLNQENGNKKPLDYFDDKIADNRILADMKRSSDITTDVVLFNIDAESDADSKTNKDALVKVFMKVFNNMQGFCGSMPWIADLERKMVEDSVYDNFLETFYSLSGTKWVDARDDFYFEEDNIIKALSSATKMSEDSAKSWYDKAEANYSLSIKEFAKKALKYNDLKTKETGKKHHVVFLVDEIGQYIGDSNPLMLNLQTIVEELGTWCKGDVWVIATSQQDIDSITKVNRDNFSKILGRFDTRLSLSSANVDEVIKKRLLDKTDTAKEKLRLLYAEKNAIIKNLITFTQDTPEKKLYANENDFVDVYPFIPYHFNMLQAVFAGIRTHGASGKHLSEGERSLLNAFQDAAVKYSEQEDGILIPFDAFFSTIETFLDHNIKTVIMHAESNHELKNEDIPVLKVLFMVKYIPDKLPANLENITSVMIKHIDEDKIETKKRIDASLRRLMEQRLIAKNGNEYIFLTNEEQDINREISEIKIDTNEIMDKVGNEIFSLLFGLSKKYRHENRYDFGFNTYIDNVARGTQREEIGIRIITPMYNSQGELPDEELKYRSLRENNIIVLLPDDATFIYEMEQSLQIETFLRKNANKAATDVIEDIKTTKTREARQRIDRCKSLIHDGLRRSAIFVNGNKLDIKEKDPSDRVNEAFKVLIESIFNKLNYIDTLFFTTEDLRKIFAKKSNQTTLEGFNKTIPNKLAIEEMRDYLTRSSYKNIQLTIKTIIEVFSKIPYGWKEYDIAGIVLTLFKSQEIRFELSGENISANDLNVIDYTTKRDYLDRLVVKMRVKIDPVLVNNAKDIIKEVFGKTTVPNDEDGIIVRFKELAETELYKSQKSITRLLDKYDNFKYPGKDVLKTGEKLLERIVKIRDIKSFFELLQAEKDSLHDYAEDVSDVKTFFDNQQPVFDRTVKMLAIYKGNETYILDKETISLVEQMKTIINHDNPYSQIHELPDLVQSFMNRFSELLEKECEPIKNDILTDKQTAITEVAKLNLDESFSKNIDHAFSTLVDRIAHVNNIYEAIAMRTESDRLKIRLIDEAIAEAERIKALENVGSKDAPVSQHKTKTVSVKKLFSGTNKVSSKEDIDKLLEVLRKKLEAELEEDTTITIV